MAHIGVLAVVLPTCVITDKNFSLLNMFTLSIKRGPLLHRISPDAERNGAYCGHISMHICFTQCILAFSSPSGVGTRSVLSEYWWDVMVVGGNVLQA